MARAFFRGGVALFLSLVFNGILLLAMAQLNLSRLLPRVRRPPPRMEVLSLRKRPSPRKKRPLRRPRMRFRSTAAALPRLQIPSRVALPGDLALQNKASRVIHPPRRRQTRLLGKSLVMTEDTVDVPPRLLSRVAPHYPPSAEGSGVEGEVQARILINQQGRVEQVIVLRSRPPGVFDDAATRALYRWRFQPAIFQGQKLKVWARQKIIFRLP